MKKAASVAVVACTVAILDFITKKIVVSSLSLYDSVSVLPFLNIVYVENPGAAFSMFTSLGNRYFIVLGAIAIIAIITYLTKLPRGLEMFALSLILGGAAGNLIDRIRIGKVVDFIDIFVGSWHWPAFNIADSALTIGIILFLIANLWHGRKTQGNNLPGG